MGSDIKLDGDRVVVEGVLNAGEIRCTDREVHSGGALAGYSFEDRSAVVKKDRWVWYSDKGVARLWSQSKSEDLLTVDGLGVIAKVRILRGHSFLSRPPAIFVNAQDLVLYSDAVQEQISSQNYALSHVAGDKLVINRNGGFKGGVSVDGNVEMKHLSITGTKPVTTTPIIGLPASQKVPVPTSISFSNGEIHVKAGKEELELVGELKRLRQELNALQKQLAALTK